MHEDKRKYIDFLKEYQPSLIGLRQARKAAVCIPLIETDEGWDILFEVRAADIDSQPGDICLPGGAVEMGETPLEAAVREMEEELYVSRNQVEILGLTDVFAGGSGNLYVYPYAAVLTGYQGTFSEDEVAEVFRVPLSFFMENDPEVYYTTMKVIPQEGFPYERIYGGRDYGWRERKEEILFYRYGEYNIWGMTGKIIRAFSLLFR